MKTIDKAKQVVDANPKTAKQILIGFGLTLFVICMFKWLSFMAPMVLLMCWFGYVGYKENGRFFHPNVNTTKYRIISKYDGGFVIESKKGGDWSPFGSFESWFDDYLFKDKKYPNKDKKLSGYKFDTLEEARAAIDYRAAVFAHKRAVINGTKVVK